MTVTQEATVTQPPLTSAALLRSYIERIERVDEERRALADDIRELFAEAKSSGYDVKALRKVIALRRKDANERRDEEMILATYLSAMGMLD
jgi:uncharacterized protein (UPF0335 family)